MEFSYYNNFLPDDPEELSRYIGYENIFKLVFEDVRFGEYYKSPLRDDTRAGCFFWEAADSKVYFVDYGNPKRTHLSCIDMVHEFYKFDSYGKTVQFIKDKFRHHQGNSDNSNLIVHKERLRKIIKLFPRSWTLQDKKYWSKYGITRAHLEEDNVVPIAHFQVFEGELFYTYSLTTPGYAYILPDNTIKIYRPFEQVYKWYTNATSSTIGNIDKIDSTGDELIITKSYKDCRVLRNLGYKNVVWFQNEGQIPNVEILMDLINRFDKVYILFDNDEPGINSSTRVCSFINSLLDSNKVKSISIPRDSNTKDPSDFYEKYGENSSKEIINKIINNVTRKKN